MFILFSCIFSIFYCLFLGTFCSCWRVFFSTDVICCLIISSSAFCLILLLKCIQFFNFLFLFPIMYDLFTIPLFFTCLRYYIPLSFSCVLSGLLFHYIFLCFVLIPILNAAMCFPLKGSFIQNNICSEIKHTWYNT